MAGAGLNWTRTKTSLNFDQNYTRTGLKQKKNKTQTGLELD